MAKKEAAAVSRPRHSDTRTTHAIMPNSRAPSGAAHSSGIAGVVPWQALVLQSISRMTLTQAETAHLFVAKRQAAASRVLQAVIRT